MTCGRTESCESYEYDRHLDSLNQSPAVPRRRPPYAVRLDLMSMPSAIAESVRSVLAQRGLLEAIEAADPIAFGTLFGEIGNNAAQAALDAEMPDEAE